MRSTKFNIDNACKNIYPDFQDVWTQENDGKLSIDLDYKKDIDYYAKKLKKYNMEEKINLYIDILKVAYNKKNDLSILFNSLIESEKDEYTSEKMIIKKVANLTSIWFEKEAEILLPRVGARNPSPTRSMEVLLSCELVLRPTILDMCKGIITNYPLVEKIFSSPETDKIWNINVWDINKKKEHIELLNESIAFLTEGIAFLKTDLGISDFETVDKALRIATIANMVEPYFDEVIRVYAKSLPVDDYNIRK
jgi:hypothetical protein